MKKRALVTGITGMDGSYMADFLLEKGYDVSAVGFSLDIETNTASYAPNKSLKPSQHGYDNEFKIMKWLYTNKIIGGFENNEVN